MTKKTRQEYDAPKVKVVKFVVENGFAPSLQSNSTEGYIEEAETNNQSSKFEYSF